MLLPCFCSDRARILRLPVASVCPLFSFRHPDTVRSDAMQIRSDAMQIWPGKQIRPGYWHFEARDLIE